MHEMGYKVPWCITYKSEATCRFNQIYINTFTAENKNTVIAPNFRVRKFYGKAQFPHSFGRIARNYAETVPFHKISIPGN